MKLVLIKYVQITCHPSNNIKKGKTILNDKKLRNEI